MHTNPKHTGVAFNRACHYLLQLERVSAKLIPKLVRCAVNERKRGGTEIIGGRS